MVKGHHKLPVVVEAEAVTVQQVKRVLLTCGVRRVVPLEQQITLALMDQMAEAVEALLQLLEKHLTVEQVYPAVEQVLALMVPVETVALA